MTLKDIQNNTHHLKKFLLSSTDIRYSVKLLYKFLNTLSFCVNLIGKWGCNGGPPLGFFFLAEQL